MTYTSLYSSGNSFANSMDYLKARFDSFRFGDFIDILLISACLFVLIFFLQKSKAARITAFVLLGVLCFTVIAGALDLSALYFALKNLLKFGVLGAVVILEMRLLDLFNKSGDFSLRKWIVGIFTKRSKGGKDNSPIDAICQAAVDLSRTKTGGLIVIERKNKLDDLIHTGVDLDAVASPYLIRNIFYDGAPLHDGALIIRDGRISAAGCILPITHRLDVNQDLGTRHRAAIGMSETSDAVIVVISEESGVISLACNGELTREYNFRTLKSELLRLLSPGDTESNEMYL